MEAIRTKPASCPLFLPAALFLCLACGLLSAAGAGFALLAAAMEEELFFRGLLLRTLRRLRVSPVAAVGLSALAFGALHLVNLPGSSLSAVLVQAGWAFGFGLWAGAAAWRRQSLRLPVLVHAAVNAAAALGCALPPLYIDPGTGSMLFAILIGVLGVLRFGLKGVFIKLKYLFTGGQKVGAGSDSIPFVIFSDDRRYWPVFESVVRELDARGFAVTYLTASPDDPALQADYPCMKAEFIGTGNRPFARLNFLKATLLLSTTPGLDVYQWKRSKDVKYYVHLPHMPGELTTYRMFGVDYYDALLLSAQYQVDDCRALEKLRGLKEKECAIVGIPYMDEKARRLQTVAPAPHERTVLVAPSWGSNSLLNRFGPRLIDLLLATGYHIVIRPHPQSFTSEKELIDRLMQAYPDLEWNRDTDNFDVLNRSDVMISDFSGVIFDFSLVFEKPVICAYTDFDASQYDAWWLDTPIWTATAVPRIGPILSEENLADIRQLIDAAIEDRSYAESLQAVRSETWSYPGEGAKRAADWLMAKYAELTAENEQPPQPGRKGNGNHGTEQKTV